MDGNPSKLSNRLRAESFNEVAQTNIGLAKHDPMEFIKKAHKVFCRKKLEEFPRMCEVARVQNVLKWQEMKDTSNQGKFTGSYGWSKDGTFRFQFEIPQDLYMFMQNLVYEGFWEAHNKKIADKFMNRLCKGDDPANLLNWVRAQYGKDQGKVISHGL